MRLGNRFLHAPPPSEASSPVVALLALMILATSFAGAEQLQAQAVSGEVVSAEDGRGIPGAFVILFDADGRRLAGTLSDREGRYALRAPAAGTYTLRVEQIGFRTVTSAPLRLDAGGTWHRIEVPVQAVTLPMLTVETESRCRRRDGGAAVHALWEEVRKALELTEHTQQAGSVRYTLMQNVRETDAAHRMVLREERTRHVTNSWLPYRAAASPDQLVRSGFAEPDGRALILYGPDAEVLLSDAFADAYCFRLAAGSGGEVGLAFEPAQRRRGTTEVEGVLWVDRGTGELRRLEYGYLGLPAEIARQDAGGDIHFRRLANGAWIVDRWEIRSPLLQMDLVTRDTRAVGMRQEGGTVLAAQQAGSLIYELTGTGTVRGQVFDQLHGAPRGGTLVALSGTPFTAVTAADGTYRMEGVPPGRYAITVSSDWMLELRTPAPLDSLVVAGDDVVEKQLVTPTFAAAMRHLCPGTPQGTRARSGVIHGVALDPDSGAPLAGVTIRAEYERRLHYEVTDANGRFAFCWVPRDDEVPVHIMVWTRQHRTTRVPLLLHGPVLRHDFF
jgi:hypothetical protein